MAAKVVCQVEIGNTGRTIVVETDDTNSPELPQSVCIYLAKDGVFVQDICNVREHIDITLDGVKKDPEFVDCLVWGDSDNEDYTDKFVVAVAEE